MLGAIKGSFVASIAVPLVSVATSITASATWVYYTGNAVTFPSGKYEIQGQTVNLYSERNGYSAFYSVGNRRSGASFR